MRFPWNITIRIGITPLPTFRHLVNMFVHVVEIVHCIPTYFLLHKKALLINITTSAWHLDPWPHPASIFSTSLKIFWTPSINKNMFDICALQYSIYTERRSLCFCTERWGYVLFWVCVTVVYAKGNKFKYSCIIK